MPKDNRSRYSHYSYPRGREGRDRSPRDRDRSPHNRERDYDRERGYSSYRDSEPPRRGYAPHPYSSTYPPPGGSYMSDQRRTGFARGRGSDQQQRRPPQYGDPREGPSGGEAGPLPKFGPGSGAAFSSGARGSPQPGYSRSQEGSAVGAGGRARAREEGAGEESAREQGSGGRGNWRGGRILPAELLVTRDKELKNKKGTSGQAVVLQANYFKLLSPPVWGLYQYDVKFEPNEERTAVRKGMVRTKKDTLKAYIFDGSILYSHEKYPDTLEFTVNRTSDNKPIRITITFTKELSKSDYQYLQFFNIIMRKCYELLQLQLVGRNYFDPNNKVSIPQYQLELWPGYVSSIRQHEYDILMSAEITHKVMRQQTLLDILNETYQYQRDKFREAYQNQVIGLVALTDYNNNTYRIDDVDFEVTPMSTFTMKDKSVITYKEYYKKRYDIDIRQENQPMLVTQTKPKDRRVGGGDLVYLVPELCRATGITEKMKNTRPLMSALAEHTRVNPNARIQKLLQFNQRLYSVPEISAEFKRWNLQLDKKLIEVPARILDDELIYIGKGKSVEGENADWTKGLRSNEMFVQSNLTEWFIIFPRGKGREVSTFVTNLTRVGNGFRLRIDPPKQIELSYDNANDYTTEIEHIMSQCNPQLIMCVIMANRSDKYSAIKKKCAIDRPVPSQVILLRNTTKGMSVATKVVVQMNCKLGGAPWTVNIPLDGFMVVGFDVCHDTNSKNRDFGAMVASLDKYCTRYYSTVSAHSNGQELSNHFAMNVVKALRKYEEVNGSRPTRIMIYRDGVGEGDIAYVMEHEVGAIRKALNEAYGDPNLVKFAFILVNKRINARFFFNQENPPPGTVVDDVITNPLKFDFYLVSQFVNQGTVTPTAYSVLHSTCGLAPDKIQRLTFKLTHMYFNWCGTVRVPAPCQYAHKLAFLVAQSIHNAPDSALESILHFL